MSPVWRTVFSIASNSASSASGSWKGWPGASSIETPPSGSRKRTGPSIRFSRSPIHSPIARFSSRVVRISVTFGLWIDEIAALRSFAGTVSRGPKLTMSSAPDGADIGQAGLDRRAEAVLVGGKDAADQHVRDLGRRDVEEAGQQAGIAERLHRPAAGAGGMEDQAVEVALEPLRDGLDAGRGHAEHGDADGRAGELAPGLVGLARRQLGDHAGQRMGGIGEHLLGDRVEALHVGDRVEHA